MTWTRTAGWERMAATLMVAAAMLNATLIAVFALGSPLLAVVVGVGAPVVVVLSLAYATPQEDGLAPASGGGEADTQTSTMTETHADGGIAAE